MVSKTVTILNKTGLHARPATVFMETASRFNATISVVKGEQEVDAKSVIGLMLLEVTGGTEITIKAEGEDETSAVNELVALIERRFDEDTDPS